MWFNLIAYYFSLLFLGREGGGTDASSETNRLHERFGRFAKKREGVGIGHLRENRRVQGKVRRLRSRSSFRVGIPFEEHRTFADADPNNAVRYEHVEKSRRAGPASSRRWYRAW